MSDSGKRRSGSFRARIRNRVRSGAVKAAGLVDELVGRSRAEPEERKGPRLASLVRELRSEHVSETALLMADLLPRSLPTSQAVAKYLPRLYQYDDPQLLSLYHAIIVATVSQDREAGPLLARALPDNLERVAAERRRPFLARVLRGAYVDWSLAMALTENLPDLLGNLSDDSLDSFLRRGFALWRENSDKAVSYFRLESRLGHVELEALRQSLPLSTVRRSLQLYAQAHCGTRVKVRCIDDLPPDLKPSDRSRAFTDGSTIYLPAETVGFMTADENFRVFKAMTAIESGRIEFESFRVPSDEATEGEGDLSNAPAPPEPIPERRPPPDVQSLRQTLSVYSDPRTARDLFGLLETYRVEERIRNEYPGLVSDLDRLTEEGMHNRPVPDELEPVPAVLEIFAQRLWGDVVRDDVASRELEPLVRRLEGLSEALRTTEATVYDTLKATRAGMRVLESLLPPEERSEEPSFEEPEEPEERKQSSKERSEGAGGEAESQPGEASSSSSGARKRRKSNPAGDQGFEPLPYQGAIWLDLTSELQERARDEKARAEGSDDSGGGRLTEAADHEPKPDEPTPRDRNAALDAAKLESPESEEEETTEATEAPSEKSASHETRSATYPEWDWQIDDYKDNWCQVIEERLPEGPAEFVDDTLASYGPVVTRLKLQFQRIRREEFLKLKRMPEGDELDIDALIESVVEIHAGRPPSERVYTQRQKRIRDVAVAFLVDMSSSTQQVVQASGKTVLDIEKESLLLMAEALESLGDAYAIYGFSGYGRNRVSFCVAKEFEERYDNCVRRRISAMSGRLENRDGAAIRHSVQRLLRQPARVRLLILLSDGRPLDCGCRQYFERYAQEDTRIALREARQQHIHPFCITVDRQAQRYLKQMYGQVHYTIIDQVSALPRRLPNIYRKLTT